MPKHLKDAADQHRPELVAHGPIFRHKGLFKALKPRNSNQAEERHALCARQVDKRRQHGGHAQQQADRAGNRRMPLPPAENQRDDRAGQNRRRGDKEIHILRVSRQRQHDHARIECRRFGYAARNQAQCNRQQVQRRARAAGHPRFQHENRAERGNQQHPARRAPAGKRLAQPVGRRHRRAGEQRERKPHRQLAHAEQTDKRRGQHGQQRPGRLARPLRKLGRQPLPEEEAARLPERFGLHADKRLLRADSGRQTRQPRQPNEHTGGNRRPADRAVRLFAHRPRPVAPALDGSKENRDGNRQKYQRIHRKHRFFLTPPSISDRPPQSCRNR